MRRRPSVRTDTVASMATAAFANARRDELVLDRRRATLAVVIGLQALWLGALMLGGWYSGADLANLSIATDRSLDLDYLTMSAGGHFGAPSRFVYWVLNRAAPLNWPVTVVMRLVLQALATYLLWRLLEELGGQSRLIRWVVALYAFSPLLVPASFVFSNALGVMVSQTAVLAALLLHVRYTRTSRVWQAIAVAALVLLALAFADESIILVAVLPLMSLGLVHEGSMRQRLHAAARQWPGWLALLAAAAVLLGLYRTGQYLPRTGGFTVSDAWAVAHTEWTQVLGPSLLSGPWVWSYHPEEWSAYAAPPIFLQVLGQVALVAAVALSVRANGRRALFAWSIPIVTTIGGAVVVGYARHAYLGTFIAPILRYSYFTAATLAIGVCIAFSRTARAGNAPLPTRVAWSPSAAGRLRRAQATLGVALLGLAALSTLGFVSRFWDNPAPGYVARLRHDVAQAGAGTELYDTPVPNAVLPRLVPNHFVSDVLGLMGLPVTFGGSAAEPRLVADSGAIVPATFVAVAAVTSPVTPPCGTFLHGARSTTVQLGPPPDPGEWFIELQLYQGRPNLFSLEVRDVEGNVLPIASGGSTARTLGPLVAIHRRVELGSPASLTLRSSDTQTSACLVAAYVGGPFPK